MIVLTRFEVPAEEAADFRAAAGRAAGLLRQRDGVLSVDLARNLDDPKLWTLTSRWRDVGSYRRALQGFEARSVVVPLLSRAVDEPSAYESTDDRGEVGWGGG